MPKVSVIIPCHNAGQYLSGCLASVVGQTLRDIEVIVINDSSTDGSTDIINSFADRDVRIRVITYDHVKSASQGRKDGVMAASGDFVLFVDADDFLEPVACEVLYERMMTENVDILHFDACVVNLAGVNEDAMAEFQARLKPYCHRIDAGRVLRSCFVDYMFGWTLWNKMFTLELCKTAFGEVKDGSFPKAQDVYAFFLLTYFAKSYVGFDGPPLYNYRYGAGVSGRNEIDLDRFRVHCCQALVADAMSSFASSHADDDAEVAVQHLRRHLLKECVWAWKAFLRPQDAALGFGMLFEYWPAHEIIGEVARLYWQDENSLVAKIGRAESLRREAAREIRTICVLSTDSTEDEARLEATECVRVLKGMGFDVVEASDAFESSTDSPGSEGVARITIPSLANLSGQSYAERAWLIESALKRNGVDTVVYMANSSRGSLFDLLLVKSMGVPFLVRTYTKNFAAVVEERALPETYWAMYRLADMVVVVDSQDVEYWAAFGADAMFVPTGAKTSAAQDKEACVDAETTNPGACWDVALRNASYGAGKDWLVFRDAAVEDALRGVARRLAGEITALSDARSALEAELAAVYGSRSWRWGSASLAPIRKAKELAKHLLPVNTRNI